MAPSTPRSLKRLLLVHESALVLLVVITGALGGLWAYFWQQSSQESLRINSLLLGAQQVRADLYRELKEVSRARLVQDPTALDRYWRHLYRIDRRFYLLERRSASQAETQAIRAMRQAYELMQTEMNKIFADPYRISDAMRMTLVDPAYEQRMLGEFEEAFKTFSRIIAAQQRALEADLAYWTRLAAVLMAAPILLAAVLLWYSHRSLRRGFMGPMAQVNRGAQRISQGELDHHIPEQGVAEVRELARSINAMARDLAASRDALVQSERQAALGALVPVVAHNIRNPLASIRAASQMIDHGDDPADLLETRDAIIETVDRLERWVSSLLSYLNPLTPHRTATRLGTVLDGALAPLQGRLAEKGLRVVRRGEAEGLSLPMDVDLMEQALHGLLHNAVDASPEGGAITLSSQQAGDAVVITIDDQGPGMRNRPQPDGLRPGPTTKRSGTGLGIPFAAKVCQAHGGSLEFETAPRGGTRVRITLPL
jgi:signal transduction histidine kinase